MSRSGYTPDEAFDRLRQMSQTQNIKLVAVAASLVMGRCGGPAAAAPVMRCRRRSLP